MESYEKKYKEALEWMRDLYPTMEGMVKEDAEHYFPELKESEDERISKAIKSVVSYNVGGNKIYGVSKEDMLNWLEKQGKQPNINPDDLVLDFTKRGVSLTSDQAAIYRMGVEDVVRELKGEQKSINDLSPQEAMEIAVAKCFEQGEQKPTKTVIEAWKDMRLEVYQQASGNRHEPNYSDDTTKMFSLNDIDEIFEKIAGTNVEQKPAESIVDKEALKAQYQKGWEDALHQLPEEIDSQIWQIANNSAKTFEESVAILIATQKGYNKGKKDALNKQKPTEWSEEDEKMLKEIEHSLCCCEDEWSSDMSEEKDWLKNRLKSLRPQNRWNPTEEQMEALYEETQKSNRIKDDRIVSLYNDLKKLMEE